MTVLRSDTRPDRLSAEPGTSPISALGEWLLSDTVVRAEPDLRGGVASWIEPDGTLDALYPEIGGYHLQFLALLARSPLAGRAAGRAREVATWLEAIGRHGLPLTIYRRQEREDWRNDVSFSFDLAIITRGLALASRSFPGQVRPEAWQRYAEATAEIVEDGKLACLRPRAQSRRTMLPVKWSTTFQPHLAKAAAALLSTPGAAGHDVAITTLDTLVAGYAGGGPTPSFGIHPYMYFIEGLLTAWSLTEKPHYLDGATRAFAALLPGVERELLSPDGRNENSLIGRMDAVAQIVRSGILLAALGAISAAAWRPLHDALFALLRDAQAPSGAVCFELSRRQCNTWATIFAWQAHAFAAEASLHDWKPRQAAAQLI